MIDLAGEVVELPADLGAGIQSAMGAVRREELRQPVRTGTIRTSGMSAGSIPT
jgi:hypothetical protein